MRFTSLLAALHVHGKTGGNFRVPEALNPIAYAHEGKWVECGSGERGWFNIHSEYMYRLWENKEMGRGWCEGIEDTMCCGVQ